MNINIFIKNPAVEMIQKLVEELSKIEKEYPNAVVNVEVRID